MATVASFKAAFPEFSNAPDALVALKIASAEAVTSATVWGSLYEDGVHLRVADMLAKSPYGRKMQLVLKDGSTAYSADLQTLVTLVAVGIRTA